MAIDYQKVKSVAKQVHTKGPDMDRVVLETMRKISELVGATLGPNGNPVLIERYEHDLPAFVTKDGVTVFKALGFQNAVAHCIMETARDAAIRTAVDAGDGTTTATILSEAIVRNIHAYTKANPRVSVQKAIRHIQRVFKDCIEPTIKGLSRPASLKDEDSRRALHSVAKISANGDSEMADAVLACFDVCGDEGNVTIEEASGPSGYEVDKIEGYPIMMGYEDSCGRYYPKFINDPGRQVCSMEKPLFLLYHGVITEFQSIVNLMNKVNDRRAVGLCSHNVVIVAIGFSDTVLGELATNFAHPTSLNIFPLTVRRTVQVNSELEFLHDLAAVTGATICDLMNSPLESAELEVLGSGIERFEANRARSTVFGYSDETLLEIRIDELKQHLESPASELDAILTKERIAKLAGGIAKLRVMGSSNGELKEKRDRADDAVCAVRGAIKHGYLPGGAWALLKARHALPSDPIVDAVLRPALYEPFQRLLSNCGIVEQDEINGIWWPILSAMEGDLTEPLVYDFLEGKHVNPYEAGILDSTPAVLEAVRNSISIATLLGTLGGTVCYPRDGVLERQEAADTAQYMRDVNDGEGQQQVRHLIEG